jgi:outer membrane protein assembly factor BamB
LYWDITVASGTVYAVSRNAGAVTAVDAVSGAQRWKVAANGDAQAVTVADGLVYAGGHFITIRGQARTILAALDPATGEPTSFSARFVTTWPGVWALAGTDDRLYVGGHFTAAGPKPNRYPYFAMFGPG